MKTSSITLDYRHEEEAINIVRPFRICRRCVMDTTAEEIVFDENGYCNFCTTAIKSLAEVEADKGLLPVVVSQILTDGKGQEYDVLIGLSGGVDSSMALHHAVKLGLRPLCFTLDTGWNTPTADENIMKLVEALKVPLFRYVIDLPKFKKLQAAYLQSGLKNIEVPTDHVLMAVSYELAAEHSIKYIISGGNVATESIMPASWGYNARDLRQMKAVYLKYAKEKLTGLPVCSLLLWNVYRWMCGIRTWYILDHYDYNRDKAIEFLGEQYLYKYPGEKHCESVYTWWFQNYYLFEKFGIDKRKAHYSSLIMSGQITRELAMESLANNPEYPKIGIEDRALNYTKHDYTDFPRDEKLYKSVAATVRTLKWLCK